MSICFPSISTSAIFSSFSLIEYICLFCSECHFLNYPNSFQFSSILKFPQIFLYFLILPLLLSVEQWPLWEKYIWFLYSQKLPKTSHVTGYNLIWYRCLNVEKGQKENTWKKYHIFDKLSAWYYVVFRDICRRVKWRLYLCEEGKDRQKDEYCIYSIISPISQNLTETILIPPHFTFLCSVHRCYMSLRVSCATREIEKPWPKSTEAPVAGRRWGTIMLCPHTTWKIIFSGEIPKSRVWDREGGADWEAFLQYKPLSYGVEEAIEGERDEKRWSLSLGLTHKEKAISTTRLVPPLQATELDFLTHIAIHHWQRAVVGEIEGTSSQCRRFSAAEKNNLKKPSGANTLSSCKTLSGYNGPVNCTSEYLLEGLLLLPSIPQHKLLLGMSCFFQNSCSGPKSGVRTGTVGKV